MTMIKSQLTFERVIRTYPNPSPIQPLDEATQEGVWHERTTAATGPQRVQAGKATLNSLG